MLCGGIEGLYAGPNLSGPETKETSGGSYVVRAVIAIQLL